jgi:hypothetical protein
MATFVFMSSMELAEAARCCRHAAKASREEAAATQSPARSLPAESEARFREELAEMFERAALYPPAGRC